MSALALEAAGTDVMFLGLTAVAYFVLTIAVDALRNSPRLVALVRKGVS